jgi:hypothetical protein
MIRVSFKGLAKFMTGNDRQKRKVLHDFKYPDDDESRAQAMYYREAREFIAAYHGSSHPASWLLDRSRDIASQARLSSGQTKTRLNNNARALKEYETNFSGRSFTILPDLRFRLTYGQVELSVVPDLHVQEGSKEKLIKLEFAKKAPEGEVVSLMSQVLFEAALQNGHTFTSASILYLDVPRGIEHRGARLGSRRAAEIVAACQNIESLWPDI